MEAISIEATENTPEVLLDPVNNKISFEGDSRPEDVRKFYAPLLDWLEDYDKSLEEKGSDVNVVCDFKLEYFNSSSAKYFMDIMETLKEINENESPCKITINWHYEEFDEDMLDAGQEFQDVVDMPFNLICIDD